MAHAAAIRISRAASVDHVLFAEPAGEDRTEERTEIAANNQRATISARSADSAVPRGATWRFGELETDARMLFYRSTSDRALTRLALVDGSMVRAGGRRSFHIALPRVMPDFFTDRSGVDCTVCRRGPEAYAETAIDSGPSKGTRKPCVASPVS